MFENSDPLFQFTDEERRDMTREDYCTLIEEHNAYARNLFGKLNEGKEPKFNTIEELMAYYDCIPLKDAINNLDQLFNDK